jgi:predicted pyridoxine 5'-phosphate oxidase superfamily flavin-nucleotide-binding protein
MEYASDVAFTPAVKRIQTERGSRAAYARMETMRGGFAAELTADVIAFIADRKSAYLATANAQGQPYIQHRGGAKGFLHVVDSHTIAFADYVGNKQYITTGNLEENDRAFLFLMDYEHADRIKIWGHARVVRDDPELQAELVSGGTDGARVEQLIVFTVVAWDGNCPQHIPRFLDADDVLPHVQALQKRIGYLEKALHDAGIAFD